MTWEADYDESLLTGEGEEREPRPTPTGRLIGCAGTGKTYLLGQRKLADPNYGLLCATTGIAAMNLGGDAVTLNSRLGYFDTRSMHQVFQSGQLVRVLHKIAQGYRNIIVEEHSMMEHEQLDILYQAVDKVNQYADVKHPMGILLVGDLAQLPPIGERGRPTPWIFKAMNWDRFAANTERLTKVWRQGAGPFLDALNFLRAGDGPAAADALESLGVTWHTVNDMEFLGTTIVATNKEVDTYNFSRLVKHPGRPFIVKANRWGMSRDGWGFNEKTKVWGIPPESTYKIGSQVMILANDTPAFNYVNGDGGLVREYHEDGTVDVELFRNGKTVNIRRVVRDVDRETLPDHYDPNEIPEFDGDDERYQPQVHFRRRPRRRYILGQVEYLPIRLGYASSVHKSQGLTLDRVQIEFTHKFFGSPAMLYTALSRCRTFEGLRLRGSKDHFVRQCNIATEVLPWL